MCGVPCGANVCVCGVPCGANVCVVCHVMLMCVCHVVLMCVVCHVVGANVFGVPCDANVCVLCVQMVSAERVMQYSALRPEAPLDTTPPVTKPPPNWPQRGKIVLDGVSFRYSEDTPTVLKSLSCTIQAAEKVSWYFLSLVTCYFPFDQLLFHNSWPAAIF